MRSLQSLPQHSLAFYLWQQGVGIVMTHMRVRGYLTGEDQRAITEFLQGQ